MWILQELHDTPGVDSATQAVIMQHMRLVGEWGTDFEQFYGNPCNATAPPHRNLTELPNCFPTTSCNSDRVSENANCKRARDEGGGRKHMLWHVSVEPLVYCLPEETQVRTFSRCGCPLPTL